MRNNASKPTGNQQMNDYAAIFTGDTGGGAAGGMQDNSDYSSYGSSSEEEDEQLESKVKEVN